MSSQSTVEMLDVNGAAIQMLRGGSGAPLLYLHSAGGESWMPFHSLLAERFEVLAPFHPGFAASEGIERIDSIEDMAFHYLDLLDTLGFERVNIAGMSLGGWIAAEIATRNPERVGRLALIDPVGIDVPDYTPDFEYFQDPLTNPAYVADMRRRTFYDPTSAVAFDFIPERVPDEKILLVLRAREATARLAWNPYFHNPKLYGRLRRIKSPALILWGDSDGLVPVRFAKLWQAGIPGSRVHVFEKCGHVPPIEKPREFAQAMFDFLA